ncbi:unnamed protein product [Rotaria magnacalcarata]|uniref:Uncharacterized protein n=1 Tax=Rotaria magnacalcarata TaxID=392030 RepID=A0A814Q0F6_9BILA|nr:unnamed protein product [Rotaria magnacalcarata]CAF4023111.1 unnamed protein product [Rotaria magnacalcarata]
MLSQERSTQTDQSLVTRPLSSLKLKDGLKFASSLLLPLALGVFTVIITFEQHNSSKQQREVDRKGSELQREQERNLTDQKYQNDRFDTYINAMAKLLEKNSGSLRRNDVTSTVARVKTLNTFRQLDAHRNVQIIRFLYEAKQLTDTPENLSRDLSTAKLFNIDFRDAAVDAKLGVKKLDQISLAGIFLSNVTFAGIQIRHANFSHAQFRIANFSLGLIDDANFSSASLNHANFSFGNIRNIIFESSSLLNINFSSGNIRNAIFEASSLRNINFLSVSLINVSLSSNQIYHANFTSAKLLKVSFSFGTLQNVDFSYSLLSNVDFTSATLSNVCFSHAQLVNVKFISTKLNNVSFSSTELSHPLFSNVELHNTTFASAILASAEFSAVQASFTNFTETIALQAKFVASTLTYSNFSDSNLKRATFVDTNLKEIDFSRANLYKVFFRNTDIEDVQLERALSIHGVELSNGTRIHDINLINDGQLSCKHALIHGWTLKHVNVTVVMSNQSNNNCQFNIQPLSIEATMYKRINLLDKWGSRFWSYSQAELNASMSTGVAMELRGINSNDRVVARQTLNFTITNTRLLLSDEILELEVFIDFTALGNGSNVADYWFDDIKLIIIYGTYSELLRFMPIIPADVKWAQNGVTVAGDNGQGNANNQLSSPYGVFVDDDQTVFIADMWNHRIIEQQRGDITSGQGSGNDNETVVLSGNETVVLGGNEHVVWSANEQLIESGSERVVERHNGKVVAGGNEQGNGSNQLDYPMDVLSEKETNSLIICDEGNRRVVRWPRRYGAAQGEILIDNIQCCGLAMDDQRYLYVSDIEKNEVRRYRVGNKNNTLVAGGNGKGHGLSQLSEPRYLFVDREQNVYVSDYNNHRVMKWTKDATEGIIVAGGDGKGTDKTQLYYPNGIFVDILGTLYVADTQNHRVMRWAQGAKQGKLAVGGSRFGTEPNQLNEPTGLSLDLDGNLYVVDCKNQRVQQFALE